MQTGYVDTARLPVSPEDAKPEVRTIYVGPNDRWIVSLVVGYDDQQMDGTEFPVTPKGALAAAIMLTRDQGSPDTTWFVYDRATGETFEFEQDDVADILGGDW